MRVAQAKPTAGKRRCSMRGMTTPPREPPVVAIPIARPRRREKKWPIAEIAGEKIREVPRPARRPKVRRKCQYSWMVSLAMQKGLGKGGAEG